MQALNGPLKGKIYSDVPEQTNYLVDNYRTNMEFFQVTYERTDKGWEFVKQEPMFSTKGETVKNNYLVRPVDELMEIYSNALRDYVKNRITNESMHIEDFAVEISNFSECFYSTIQALPNVK